MDFFVDFFKFEIKRCYRSIYFWIIQIIPVYFIYQEASRYLGKGGDKYSILIKNNIIHPNQEMMAMAVIFVVPTTVLLSIYFFSNNFKLFLDNKYSEIVLNKQIQTHKLIFFKLLVPCSIFICINLIISIFSTMYIMHVFNSDFQIIYYLKMYFIYSIIPVIFILSLSFLLNVMISDGKIIYPILLMIWFFNLFPASFSLNYIDWQKVNLKNPIMDIGLLTNRLSYLLISLFFVLIGYILLNNKRSNLFTNSKFDIFCTKRNNSQKVYTFYSSMISRLKISFKTSISWKILIGLFCFIIIPPALNKILPQIYDGIPEYDLLNRIIIIGQVYLSLAVLLYLINALFVEDKNNIKEILLCKPAGMERVYNDKFKVIFISYMLISIAFYASICVFVSNFPIIIFMQNILLTSLFYFSILFFITKITNNVKIASVSSLVLWAVNYFFSRKIPMIFSTFPKLNSLNNSYYSLNRYLILVITILLFLIGMYFNKLKVGKLIKNEN